MKIAVFIGQRLSIKSDGKKSAGAYIAVTGIALSFIIMLAAISIVTGFKHEISNKLIGFNAQLTVYPPDRPTEKNVTDGIRFNDTISDIINRTLPQCQTTLVLRQPAIFKTDNAFQGIALKGLPPSATDWDFIKANLLSGTVPDDTTDINSVVISHTTAAALGINTGEKILTHFFQDNSIRTRNLKVTGIYDSHFNDYDKTFAFTPIAMLQNLCKIDSKTGTALEIRGIEYDDVWNANQNLYTALLEHTLADTDKGATPTFYRVDNVLYSCAMYYSWLDLLNTNVVVIIILMAFVSAFTLISSLFIIILERVRMIGMLKAMGATDAQIRSIFIYLTERLVVKGLVIGNCLGISLLLLQSLWHILPLNPEAYYLNYVPVEINIWAIVVLNLAVIIMSWLILILPSHIVAKISPARSIRFE